MNFLFAARNTGRRTARVMTVILSAVLLFASPVLADVGQQEIELPQLADVKCQSYFVYDRTKGEEVISSNPDRMIYPASMTKVMTAALALDYLTPDQILTTSSAAIGATTPNSTLMGLKVGEEISVSEILYGLMLPSGNDAANVLAEAVVTAAGYSDPSNPDRSKLDLFADIMNQKVQELGLTRTHFSNANGLHDDNHYTTASDLAKIFDYALSHDEFRAVISSPTHVFKATNIASHDFDGWYVAKNTNCLLADPWILGSDTKVAQVVGGKTGTTIAAGTGMVVLTVDQNGDELITAVCGIPYDTANRLTTYVAAVVDAGAAACFDKDPVVRVQGNVIDNKPVNAPAGQGASGYKPTEAPTAAPTEPAAPVPAVITASPTPAAAVQDDTIRNPADFFRVHPVISIAIIAIVAIVLILVITYFLANRRRRFRNNRGIRRI